MEITPEQQAKVAEKIGKLIAMAEDEANTPAARAAYAAKAESLMRQYRIDEENVISGGGEAVTVPQFFDITLLHLKGYFGREFHDEYTRLWREIARHAGLKSHVEYRDKEPGSTEYRLAAVGFGYEMDIRLAQFLWTAAHLAFVTRIDTKVDPSLSDQENCYYMRGSGMDRKDVAYKLWGSEKTDGAAHGKVQTLYVRECSKRGEEVTVGGRGFQAERYRKHYAEGFVDQFGWRLRDARSAVDAESGTLVLAGRDERIAQAYYAEYPKRAPRTAEQLAADAARSEEYWAAKAEQERICRESGKCSKAKSGHCREHRPYEATVADRARWSREENAPERTAGRRAGSAAASSVDFRRTGGERTHKAPTAARRELA